ncbi:TetR/AcrR family transcriptional regulator [Amycolatopsis taiwanensis]|uniref:Transcriptional regulatory protein TetR n=1 Tax=Amycolatopsis taiwanensis TaxID=342230 RepID=A0A9W6QVU3_9PSEU|nr:TetR/AcrR family transcriptional regulator [Amycolatopsis taiwanensis]GLY63870.1 putative transcriptional regulatory protein TetR [Amycolatopsis taiwanensis]
MSEKPTLRADARRNRARVLAAAQEAFADEGTSVPLDEIARRAGVGAGTVYRHFPSKEALYEAVVLDRIGQLGQQASELLGAADPGAAFFEFFEVVATHAVLNKALCEAIEAGTGFGMKTGSEQQAGFRAVFGDLLARAQATGAVRADIEPGDLPALLAGYLAIQRQAAPGRPLARIISDGLRP